MASRRLQCHSDSCYSGVACVHVAAFPASDFLGGPPFCSLVLLVFTWRHFRPAISWGSALLLLVLAAVANACCCSAYPVDIFFQRSSHRSAWLRRRWILWSAGVILAVFLACYWIVDEIYPFVN